MCGLTCMAADVAAKAASLLGSDGPAWLDARGLPGRFVSASGEIALNRSLAAEPRANRRMHLTSSPVDWYAARAAGITAYLLLSGGRAARPDDGGEDAARAVAAIRPRGCSPLRRPSRRQLRHDPRRDDRDRLVAAVHAAVADRAVHLAVSAALGRPRHRRRGAPGRTRRDQPLPAAAAVRVLAARALPQLRGLERRDASRHRQRHRPKLARGLLASVRRRGRPLCPEPSSGALRVHAWDRWIDSRRSVACCCRDAPHRRARDGTARGSSPRPWNAASFSEQLTGQVTQLNGVSRGIVSMVGQGQGQTERTRPRRPPDRAATSCCKTSFQMEYLPSGELCTGSVTAVHATAFAATCQLRTGGRRRVQARWQASDSAELAGGIIIASRF